MGEKTRKIMGRRKQIPLAVWGIRMHIFVPTGSGVRSNLEREWEDADGTCALARVN